MTTTGTPGETIRCQRCGAWASCQSNGEIRPHRKQGVEGNVMCYG